MAWTGRGSNTAGSKWLPRTSSRTEAKLQGEVTVSAVVSDTARLPCRFSFIQGLDDLRAVWEKKGRDVNNVQIYKIIDGRHDLSIQDSQYRGRTELSGDISKGNLELTLSWVTMNDDGVYFCRAANRIDHGDNMVILSVSALPPQMIESVAGGEVTLELKYNGDPSEIIWKLDTSKIVEKESASPVPWFFHLADRAVLNPNGSLTIRDLRKEDSGVYKSEVLVNNYIQETERRLTVLDRVSKPTITGDPSAPHIVLTCHSSTINVTYRWLDKTRGEPVSTEQKYTAPRPSEGVELVCIVKNSVSEANESITIPSDIGRSARPQPMRIIIIISSVLNIIAIIIAARYCYKAFRKKQERDMTCIDRRENTADYEDTGFQKTTEDKRHTTDHLLPTHEAHKKSSDRDDFSEEATEGAQIPDVYLFQMHMD